MIGPTSTDQACRDQQHRERNNGEGNACGRLFRILVARRGSFARIHVVVGRRIERRPIESKLGATTVNARGSEYSRLARS
ncbi:hypothetical protein RSSM_03926 [Rhodopirellula sallentina SM41]|uniref:Uncharacterized protein n=1 Tax=Rhodopirellula sallentina SM41 TaxID=1263870 RepID=M5U9U6_9BACT|nr:hypothetical protein RSSM_03926 [Rhodopirellula sallentina SM41]